MSGRLLKKVLKEHEESKHQNHHDEEEEEDEEEDLGGRSSSINPFDLLNEGDEEDPESEKVSQSLVDSRIWNVEFAIIT